MQYYLACATSWMNFKDIVSKTSQTQKDRFTDIQIHRNRKENGVSRDWGLETWTSMV